MLSSRRQSLGRNQPLMLTAPHKASLSGHCMSIKQPKLYNHSPLVLCYHTCNQFCVAMLPDFSKDWGIMDDFSPVSQMRILKGNYIIIKNAYIAFFVQNLNPNLADAKPCSELWQHSTCTNHIRDNCPIPHPTPSLPLSVVSVSYKIYVCSPSWSNIRACLPYKGL